MICCAADHAIRHSPACRVHGQGKRARDRGAAAGVSSDAISGYVFKGDCHDDCDPLCGSHEYSMSDPSVDRGADPG